MAYAFPSVKVKPVMVTTWPVVTLVESSSRSAPLPVTPHDPCMWAVDAPESYTRKCPAVPVPSALASCQDPLFAFAPEAAAAIQAEGKFNVARTDPLSAVAHDAGCDPVRILRMADTPTVDSMASRRALRTLTE